jgi:periplasmic protein TonB
MRRGFWTSRAIALAAIVALHGLVGLAALLYRVAPPAAPEAEPFVIALVTEQRAEIAPAPGIPLQEMRLPTPVIPVIDISIPEEITPATITVATLPEVAAAPEGESHAPIMATMVEWVRRPVVVYPPEARRARATGTVQVRALVEKDGHVGDARVHRSSGFALLDRAACDSVRNALFRPYTLDGMARSALVIVPVEFSLTIRTASR